MKNDYSEWTPVKDEDEAIQLQKGRKIAILIGMVGGELSFSAKRIDLLTREELEDVAKGCELAAHYHTMMASIAMDMLADQSSYKPQ